MTDRLTLRALILANVRQQPARTAVLAALTALFCITLFIGAVLDRKAGQGMRLAAERLGADILFVPYGHEIRAQNALLRGEPGSFYMDRGFAEALRHEPGVERVTTQLFLATLKASCCTLPVQLIGFDPATDFVVRPWMAAALDRPLQEDEVVVGCKIAAEPGESIRLFGRDFRIAARLDATGIGFDASVFLEQDRARRLLLLSELGPRLDLPQGLDRNSFVSSTLVKAAPGVDVTQLANALSEKYAAKYNLDFAAVADMMSDIAATLQLFSGVFQVLAAGLWAAAVLVTGLVFSLLVRERRREFGLLRLMGASRGQLVRLVVGEAMLVSGAGAGLGTLAAGTVFALFSTWAEVTLRLPRVGLSLQELCGAGAVVAGLGLLTGPAACLPVISRLNRMDTHDIVREEA